jgi:hypothetical protein
MLVILILLIFHNL